MKDIVSYLQLKGYTVTRIGNRFTTNSPIKALRYGSIDTTPSFVIYPDGGAKCFATGWYGDITSLARVFGEQVPSSLPDWRPLPATRKDPWANAVPHYHLNITPQEKDLIDSYARSRRITRGYIPATFKEQGERKLALLFTHVDRYGNICGGKFRAIGPTKRRFTLRGHSGFYCLENSGGFLPPEIYFVESETSANSLWEITSSTNSIIVSSGGVDNVPPSLPDRYQGLPGYLVVDYDGSEELYEKRIKKYNHLGLKPLKLILPKGEDINSLYCKGEEYLIRL